MPSEDALAAHIIELSTASSWYAAKAEWSLDRIYMNYETQHCPCGHVIQEVCVIRNRTNGNETEVGNVCVHKFMAIDSKPLFDSFRRVKSGASDSFSEEMIEYALRHRLISDWDAKFYLNIRAKRKLSDKQRVQKNRINEQILKFVVK